MFHLLRGTKQLEETYKVSASIVNCKVMTCSVLEAIKTTLEELETEKESHGIQHNRNIARKPTDVIGKIQLTPI